MHSMISCPTVNDAYVGTTKRKWYHEWHMASSITNSSERCLNISRGSQEKLKTTRKYPSSHKKWKNSGDITGEIENISTHNILINRDIWRKKTTNNSSSATTRQTNPRRHLEKCGRTQRHVESRLSMTDSNRHSNQTVPNEICLAL